MKCIIKTALPGIIVLLGHLVCLAGSPRQALPADTTAMTDFGAAIARMGLDADTTDYSDSPKIKIGMPACAYVNITGTDAMPASKNDTMHVCLDVYTDDGSHFLKRAVISAQGNSSMAFPKKNIKVDFCEDEWVGKETTALTIGDWVKQDGFHFKAYYVDYLRGVGVVGLQLYHLMALHSGRPWQRAHGYIDKPDENARCYPDGFPCIVFLNGNFHGIYAWQLKKHRKNMNLSKSCATHIHLDGKLDNKTFWGCDNISWNRFEVRNPKRLYTMDGQPYDGDNPKELIDESSEYYLVGTDDEATSADKQRTASVKHCIEELSGVCSAIQEMVSTRRSRAEIRALIEEHFDMTSLIDYACFHFAVNNYDGFGNNWQWFTYDGKKWFVTPYDLDCTFGNWYTGVTPPDRMYMGGGKPWSLVSTFGPLYWVDVYFADELKERYATFRDAGIIDAGRIIGLLENWYYSVSDYYAREWQRWPESRCISETVASPGWAWRDDGYTMPAWNADTTYHPGDRCTLEGLAWEATATVQGVKPYVSLGYRDSLERYEEWITRRIELLDAHFGWQPDGIREVIAPARSRYPHAVYDLQGRPLAGQPRKGVYIRDGKKTVANSNH